MEENELFPVDLGEYRAAISEAGAKRRAAVIRVELTTDILRDRVVKAVRAGVSQAEAARLAQIPRVTVRAWLGLK